MFKNIEDKKRYDKKYYQLHKEEIRQQNLLKREKRIQYMRIWREKNRKYVLDYSRNYKKHHKLEIAKYQRKRMKRIEAKIRHNLAGRIWVALRKNIKSTFTMKLIGCSIEFLKKYLEKQFTKGMNWLNYGKWHIDHIKPCCAFDLSKESEQYKCFHYTNLQPLWAEDNLSKNGKQT